MLPTRPAINLFHLVGRWTTNIDEKFESGPGRFGAVESTDPLQYPAKVVANSDLAARLDQLQTLVIAGILLGALALLASAAGLVMRRR